MATKSTRIALVTGGMGGLGEAICIKLAALGYKVVTTYSPGNTKATEWLDSMHKQGFAFSALPCDVTDWESCVGCVKKVSQEIGSQSITLAEELTLTTAELSYLQDRKVAYENLAKRTDLEGVKSVCVALQQSERYGTPLGQTLRVMAQENRDMRMSEAEKKAAALPPKLTVPMILFFLPVLFIVILGPAAIRVMAIQ